MTTSALDELLTLKVTEKFGLDFDDVLNYYLARKYRSEEIISFDKHFGKTDVKRLKPVDLLR